MSISSIAQATNRAGLSALTKSLKANLQRHGFPAPSHAAMRQILAESLGFSDPGALLRTTVNDPAPTPAPATARPPKDASGLIIQDNFALEFVRLGEGYHGEYDPTDPDDCEFLRVDLYELSEGEWQTLDGGSYCTQLPAKTALWKQQKIAIAALAWVVDQTTNAQITPRRLAGALSHLNPHYQGGNPVYPDHAAMVAAGLDTVEIKHALESFNGEQFEGPSITLINGRQIQYDLNLVDDSYLRILAPVNGWMVEVAYWNMDELAEDGLSVLGALFECAGRTIIN